MDFFKKLRNRKRTTKSIERTETSESNESAQGDGARPDEKSSPLSDTKSHSANGQDRLSKPLLNNDLSPINPLTGKYEFDELDETEELRKANRKISSRFDDGDEFKREQDDEKSATDKISSESEEEHNAEPEILSDFRLAAPEEESDELQVNENDLKIEMPPEKTEFTINEAEILNFEDPVEESADSPDEIEELRFEDQSEAIESAPHPPASDSAPLPGETETSDDELEELHFDQTSSRTPASSSGQDENESKLSEQAKGNGKDDIEEFSLEEPDQKNVHEKGDGEAKSEERIVDLTEHKNDSEANSTENIAFDPENLDKNEKHYPDVVLPELDDTSETDMNTLLTDDIESALAEDQLSSEDEQQSDRDTTEENIVFPEELSSESQEKEEPSSFDETSEALDDLLKIKERYSPTESSQELPRQQFTKDDEDTTEVHFDFDSTDEVADEQPDADDGKDTEREFPRADSTETQAHETPLAETGIPAELLDDCKAQSDAILNELLESHDAIHGFALITNDGVSVTERLISIEHYDKTIIQIAALRKFADVLDAGLNLEGVDLLRLHGSERIALLFDAGGYAVLSVWVGHDVPLGMIIIEARSTAERIGTLITKLMEK